MPANGRWDLISAFKGLTKKKEQLISRDGSLASYPVSLFFAEPN